MMMNCTHGLATSYWRAGGTAIPAFRLLLFLSLTSAVLHSSRPSEKLARLAAQSTAQFVHHIGPKHFALIMVEPEQGGVRHTRLLSQAVDGPLLPAKDFSKPANDHASKVAGLPALCQTRIIYQLCFTYDECRSKLTLDRKRLCALSLRWETKIDFCVGMVQAPLGLMVFTAEVQP
jgi:hypothetical protein